MRILNGIFITVFMTMLTIPLILVDFTPDRVSVQENRMLANFPEPVNIRRHPGDFIRGFDAWFKDSTGFREQLLALYNAIGKNTWFNSIWYMEGQNIYLFGEQGHTYYAGQRLALIGKFQGKQFLTDEQLANMATKLNEVKTYFDNKGIPLVVMFCTDKETIYPEFYPKLIKQGPIQLDIITWYLQEHTGVDIFNIREALLIEKNNYLLYPLVDNLTSAPRDFAHYNEIGAFFAYRELMKHINIHFPEIIPYELDDVDISDDKIETPTVFLKAGTTYRRLDPTIFSWNGEAYENEDSSLPVILFFKDSYANEIFIGKYFANHFGKAFFIHYQNMEHLEEYINKYKPDIVVFESAERELRVFADYVAGIPILQ